MPAFIVYSCADRNTLGVRSLVSSYTTKLIAIAQRSFFAWCARVHATWEVSLNEHCMRALHSSSSCAWNSTCESPLPHTRYRSCSAASFQRVQIISCTLSSPALHAWQCTLLQKKIPSLYGILLTPLALNKSRRYWLCWRQRCALPIAFIKEHQQMCSIAI